VTRAAELRELPEEALLEQLESAKEELFNLRFQLATGQLDNPMRIKEVRREVARILTILRERELEIEPPVEPVKRPPARARVERQPESAEDVAAGDTSDEPEVGGAAPPKRRRLRRQREES
jgi:large subunit ribosomal protein L29